MNEKIAKNAKLKPKGFRDKSRPEGANQEKDKTKDTRFNAKYCHITLHKLENQDINYWVDLGMKFKANAVACLVGLEENHEEDKGVHAHIVIQFSTRQKISRANAVKYFGTDSLHISVLQKGKADLLNVLGYVSKTGNTKQEGLFSYRGENIAEDPEVYRFSYMVKSKADASAFFKKIIAENLGKDENIIKKLAKRKDAIGDYLLINPTLTRSLHKLANTWHLDKMNEMKRGYSIAEFVKDDKKLREAYRVYLEEYRDIFYKYKPKDYEIELEPDYKDHADHDLSVVNKIVRKLEEAMEYGSNRPHKTLNLYIWSSKPSFGKTRLLDFLDEHTMAYRLPDDQYYVDYESGLYSILVSDEAKAFLQTKTYPHLKHVLEGKSAEFNLKGREKVIKKDNPLIVLAENVSFYELMKRLFRDYSKEVMASRVLDLEIRSRATLHFLLDRCLIPNYCKVPEHLLK